MPLRIRFRGTQPKFPATIIEEKGNFDQSAQKGVLLTLEDMPLFLGTRLKELKYTTSYLAGGYVWFYLSTVGTKRNGYYEINWTGKTVEEMFIPIRDSQGKTLEERGNESQIREAWLKLDFYKRARFFGGDKPLCMLFTSSPSLRHLGVYGNSQPQDAAPVAVVKQPQAGSEAAIAELKELAVAAEREITGLNLTVPLPATIELINAVKRQ